MFKEITYLGPAYQMMRILVKLPNKKKKIHHVVEKLDEAMFHNKKLNTKV